ncbi:MAG: hypothetical protein RMK57_17265, partial [Bryobacterales bacterium]|nr:hypothetical protein [Bryobacterales bacterium]
QRYLLLRMDIQAATPQGSINVATFFDDYRKVDRIMYAFTTRQLASGVESVIRVERVRHNTPIDDAIFRKPKN